MGYKNDDSCLKKVSKDEPIFVLRAQDKLSDWLVDMWALEAAKTLGLSNPKVIEAQQCAAKMRKWPVRKMPD